MRLNNKDVNITDIIKMKTDIVLSVEHGNFAYTISNYLTYRKLYDMIKV